MERSWAHLPDLVLFKILSNLPVSDRTHAGMVCRQWYRGYCSSGLWKRFMITFQNSEVKKCFKTLIEKELFPVLEGKSTSSIPLEFLAHLKEVHFILGDDEPLITNFINFLKRLQSSGCTLRHLKISGIFPRHAWPKYLQNGFACFAKFLETQKSLEVCDLDFLLPPKFSSILKGLGRGSGSKLTTLRFVFQNFPKQYIIPYYYETMSLFTNLSSLTVRFTSLDKNVLRILLENNPSLQEIRIDDISTFPYPSLLQDDWNLARLSHPHLKVKADLSAWFSQVIAALPPGMPLTALSLHIKWKSSGQQLFTVSRLLEHIMETFSGTLEEFRLWNAIKQHLGEDIGPVVRDLIRGCPKLKQVLITATMSFPSVREICKLQESKQIDLQKLHLRIISLKPEDEKQIRTIVSMYRKTFLSRDWIFQHIHIKAKY